MDQKNLILAFALSAVILFGSQYFFPAPKPPEPAKTEQAAQPAAGTPPSGSVPAAGSATPAAAAPSRAAMIADTPRVKIETPRVSGSISLTGGRIDDITLITYRETVDPNSPPITLLNPAGTADAYYDDGGWTADTPGVALPGPDTRWTADRDVLRPGEPVTLSWDNGQGLTFRRVIAIDRDYMISIRQEVENHGATAVKLLPYERVARTGTPPLLGYYILHEGVVGMLGDRLREFKYKALKDETQPITEASTGGWLGFTDKYWLVALIPDQKEAVTTHVTHTVRDGVDHYQIDDLAQAREVAPGATVADESRLFAGAKEVKLLTAYKNDLGITRFDYAVDWGWFFFLTRPIFSLLDWIYGAVGNFGVAILMLTVCIRALFFPVANYSYRAMAKMKRLSPLMAELKEKYGDDRQKMNAELMQVYKREKVNPVSGCLPIALQIPVFFSLYKVLFVTIEMRHQPFFGWIHDLSAPDPTTVFNLFGLIPWMPPEALMLGAWPIIMGITMFLQQRLNPQPPDPVQAKLFMVMPVIFTFMLAHFPAGLVVYWAWNNTLSMAQQYFLTRRTGQVTVRKSPA